MVRSDGVWPGDGTVPGVAWRCWCGTGTITARLMLGGGSSADGDCPGLSHLVEHVLAKRNLPGVTVTGETGRDYVTVSATCSSRDWRSAVRLLSEQARLVITGEAVSAVLPAVIAEAERARWGRPAIWNAIAVSLWGDHPLSRPTAGDPAELSKVTGEQAERHLRRLLVAGNAWLGVAGDVDPEAVIDMVGTLNWRLAAGHSPWPAAPVPGRPVRRVKAARAGESVVAVAWPVAGGFGKQAAALRLAEVIIGGPDGRLSRTEGGFAALALYRSAGYLAALMRTPPGEEESALERLQAAVAPPTAEEINRARRTYQVRALVELETTFRSAGAAAVHALTGGPTPMAWIKQVLSCDNDSVRAVMADKLTPERLHIIMVTAE